MTWTNFTSLGSATQVISLMGRVSTFFSNDKTLMTSFSLERLTFIRVCFVHIQDVTEIVIEGHGIYVS